MKNIGRNGEQRGKNRERRLLSFLFFLRTQRLIYQIHPFLDRQKAKTREMSVDVDEKMG